MPYTFPITQMNPQTRTCYIDLFIKKINFHELKTKGHFSNMVIGCIIKSPMADEDSISSTYHILIARVPQKGTADEVSTSTIGMLAF